MEVYLITLPNIVLLDMLRGQKAIKIYEGFDIKNISSTQTKEKI